MSPKPPSGAPADDLKYCATPEAAVERLTALYDEAVGAVEKRFHDYAAGRLKIGAFDAPTYPYLCAEVPAERSIQTGSLALGRIAATSLHGASITAPRLFSNYLLDQLRRVSASFEAKLFVGRSRTPIPLTFALEQATAALTAQQREELQHYFYMPNLIATNDVIVDGGMILERGGALPLSLFTAERTDYSLHRIQHYTATKPEHYQNFILFTNYQRYVDEFVELGRQKVEAGEIEALIEPGDRITRKGAAPSKPPLAKTAANARLSLSKGQARGRDAGQYRRRPVERQDDHRPPCGSSPACVADDRPLRRPPADAAARRLCARARVSARGQCARRRAAAVDPLADDRRSAACDDGRRRTGRRHPEGPAERAAPDRHGRHDRRQELGARF